MVRAKLARHQAMGTEAADPSYLPFVQPISLRRERNGFSKLTARMQWDEIDDSSRHDSHEPRENGQ